MHNSSHSLNRRPAAACYLCAPNSPCSRAITAPPYRPSARSQRANSLLANLKGMAMAKSIARLLSIALVGLTAPAAWSQDDVPKNAVGIGWYFIFYHVYASGLVGPFTPPGAGLDVRGTNTLYLAYFRRFSPHFQLDLAA